MVVAEIERTILALTGRGGLSVLLVEQHVGFALNAAGRYYVLLGAGDGEGRATRRRRTCGRRWRSDPLGNVAKAAFGALNALNAAFAT